MDREEFRKLTENKRVILDGATGSNLLAAGMPKGVCPEQWILKNPEALLELQKGYLKAGTDILYAPTFSGNRIKLAEYGLSEKLREINQNLLSISKEAVRRAGGEKKVYVAADITMTGGQLAPLGTMDFEELVDIYKEQVKCLADAGADLVVIETMISLQECRAALLAVKETCELPVMVTLTFQEDGRTFYGNTPETAAIVLGGMGADAVGINCSAGPDRLLPLVARMVAAAEIPVAVKPNAGMPVLKDGETVYDMDADYFAECMDKMLFAGAAIVGGCCGTTPEYIDKLAKVAAKYNPVKLSKRSLGVLATERSVLSIEPGSRFLVIGERINPTGKKELQKQLREGLMDMVADMAQEQVAHGADILDINMGMNGIDEKKMMLEAMETVSGFVDVPLCIDSSHPEVIEAALRRYPGRALINSISLEKKKMETLLAAAKKYGAMFVLLPLSEQGLPKDIEEKKEIIQLILKRAEQYGLGRENVLVDGLVNTVGANKDAALQALETIRYCREELGVATMCGLSNISFGLPERQFVNAAFLAFAIQAGITAAIVNPSQELLISTAYASDLLCGKEGADVRYIDKTAGKHSVLVSEEELAQLRQSKISEKENQTKKTFSKEEISSEKQDDKEKAKEQPKSCFSMEKASDSVFSEISEKVYDAVIKGNRKGIVSLVQETVDKGDTAKNILDKMLIPAINMVGELFNEGKYFLPQLIASAEAMKIAVEYLEPMLAETKKENTQSEKAGVVVIATVSGDIHDIGKNLVALMLKNYGFTVYDLGKDVPTEKIIQKAKETDADIIAVSALMTTTMLEMKQVVKQRDAAGLRAKIMIGGAVVTQSYCEEIDADGYSKDAQEAVSVAKRLLEK